MKVFTRNMKIETIITALLMGNIFHCVLLCKVYRCKKTIGRNYPSNLLHWTFDESDISQVFEVDDIFT